MKIMNKIRMEDIIGSLLVLGFEQVDPMLYTLTLGQLSILNSEDNWFTLADTETSFAFNRYVLYDGFVYKLRDPEVVCLAMKLGLKEEVIKHLENLDFEEIILKKAAFYGIDWASQVKALFFCGKELEILKNLNLNKNNHRTLINKRISR